MEAVTMPRTKNALGELIKSRPELAGLAGPELLAQLLAEVLSSGTAAVPKVEPKRRGRPPGKKVPTLKAVQPHPVEPVDVAPQGEGRKRASTTGAVDWRHVTGDCPKCGHIGPVIPDFGVKVVRGRVYKQSWCANCRATANYQRKERAYRTP